MTLRCRFFSLWLLCATAAVLALSPARAAAPAPGTLISSRAELNYLDPVLFIARTISSNTVRVLIPGGPGLELVADRTLTRTAGSSFEFSHTLTNFGNVSGSYTVTPTFAGGPVALLNLRLVIDANGNGTTDPGEPVLPFAPYALTLPAGGVAHFLITGQIEPLLPAGLQPVTEQLFGITATLAETGATSTNTDRLRIPLSGGTDVGALQFTKSVTPGTASRGATADYTLVGTNNYTSTLDPVNITVDGANRTAFLVRDDVPANLELVQILDSSSALPLYHLAGQPTHTYVTIPPADLTLVSAVAWAFAKLDAGSSFSVSFRVRVGQSASGIIPNTATTFYRRGVTPEQTDSNVTNLRVPSVPPTILYYNNHNDSDPDRRVIPGTRLGNPLFVEVVAGACNISADTIEIVTITLTSAFTGDVESFGAVETAPNSGIYRILPSVSTQDSRVFPVVQQDGIMQTRSRDTLTAEIGGCGNVTVLTTILIDPAGIVYDSRTNAEIAGATVTLIDVTGSGNGGSPGGPAVVFDDDTVTLVPATQVTGPDGSFRFPFVFQSIYQLRVIPPPTHTFPSLIPVGLQPAGRIINLSGSFGGTFPVNLATGAVMLDVPLDSAAGTGFVLEKEVSRDVAEIGDSVIYTLTLTNNSGAAFNGTHIDDRLPAGFRYERGTTRRDGVAAPDPIGGIGPDLRFQVGTLADRDAISFTYRVRLTPGAEKGTGINVARSTTLGPPVLFSNFARARVRVELGIFDPRAVIIGTVFVDANRDTIQNPGEPGVPGIRLVLEDGTYAITDAEGQYSIYGQRAITHALKLDNSTLPPSAILGGEGPRFAGHSGLRFVDLKKHELHKANFTLVDPTESLYAAIEQRRKQIDLWQPEITTALASSFTADGTPILLTDLESRKASGIIGSGNALPGRFDSVLPPGTLTSGNSSLPPSPVAAVPLVDLQKTIATITDTSPDFIDLKDGDTLPSDRVTVRIKGALESRLSLLVNDEPAPESRIGKAIERAEPPLQATEYIALRLPPGPNTLTVVQSDLFGNERARKAITVIVPDRLARLELAFNTLEPKADGRTPLEVTVRAVDAKGVPVTADMPLTLESSLGRWEVDDVNAREPGIQISLTKGFAIYRLLPPIEPGETHIVISSGTLKIEKRVAFLPELRPMIATGIIEGRFNLNRLGSNQLLPIDPSDAFEEELREQAGIGGDGTGSGRAAFYLKGKIKGDVLLTIAYDSDKRRDDVKLFRDIDPDAYFPVYGDSSTRGYDAQSTGKLYVRLDKDRSFALLGDYNTRATDSEVRQLGDYNRSFNGVRVHHETSRFRGGLWASDASTTQVVREIAGNGTSGPYNFSAAFGLINSETVEILVRDRNQRSVILSTQTLRRNTDYDFEPFTGRILLRRPLASVDSNFNPQSLRITYEVESGGESFWVYGGNVSFKPVERIEIGGSFARDENPLDPYNLQSVNATVQLSANTYFITEAARSTSIFPVGGEQDGLAGRVEIRHKSEKTEARIHYGETEAAFINPSSQLNSGRVEGGAKVTHSLTSNTQVIGEAVHTADATGAFGEKQGARIDVAHTLPNQVKLTVGVRASEETRDGAVVPGVTQEPISVRSVRARVDTPVPNLPQAGVFGEYEQDVVIADQRIIAAGGNYQVSTKTRLYLRHEFINSLGSPFELSSSQQNNRTLFGIETEYMRDAHFYNEYRVRNAIDGGQAEASTGLRNDWNVADGLRLNTTFERITPISDGNPAAGLPATESESTAATLGYDYTRPENWKTTGRIEGRWADSSDNYLNTLGYARKLNDQWTFLGRTILNAQLTDDTATAPPSSPGFGSASADLWQGRILTGLAWRQTEEDIWNALFRYEYKYEAGATNLGSADMARQVHTLATSVNYQPDRRWIFAGHYATKFVQETYDFGPDGDYIAHLLAGRVIYEFHRRWDAGLNLAVTFSDSFANRQWAIGPEIGFIFTKNARIGLGYNIVGFNDRDFDASATSRGLFLSLRVKFDENLLKWARFDRSEGQP